MSVREGKPTIDSVRAAAKLHADARGLRAVAREIGISPMGLSRFLSGAEPYNRTATALGAWYRTSADEALLRRYTPVQHPLAGISDDEIRSALQRAVAASSAQAVAEQVGLTRRALQLFISGETRPREVTLRKLREWYMREAASLPETGEATVRAAIAVLLEAVPRHLHERAAQQIRSVVRQACTEAAVDPPAWTANAAA